jgi:hypothetical protein
MDRVGCGSAFDATSMLIFRAARAAEPHCASRQDSRIQPACRSDPMVSTDAFALGACSLIARRTAGSSKVSAGVNGTRGPGCNRRRKKASNFTGNSQLNW